VTDAPAGCQSVLHQACREHSRCARSPQTHKAPVTRVQARPAARAGGRTDTWGDDGQPHNARVAPVAHRPDRTSAGARAAAGLWWHGACRGCADRRARGPWPRRDPVRPRRFHRPRHAARADGAARPATRRPGSRPVGGLPRGKRHECPSSGQRIRCDPLPPRVDQPAPVAGDAGPCRHDLPWPAGPALCCRCTRCASARARRDQPLAGGRPSARALGRHRPQRARAAACPVHGGARAGPLLRGPDRPGEGHPGCDRDRPAERPPPAHRREGGPHAGGARLLQRRVPAGYRDR
jgi:hypothetical protein